MPKKKTKALVLLSGGLDSILAVKILLLQKIEVLGLCFKSYFFNEELAQKAAKKLKIPLKVIDFSKNHLKIVKNPKYNYGKSLNPCLDCHLLMLREARKIMKKEGFDFVATGEVLGSRPLSQNPNALKLLEKESLLRGYLLRPLSAKLLEPTISEIKGLVNREKLFAISGRQRKEQLFLVKKYQIDFFPQPAGGCILTDCQFGKRLKELFEKHPKSNGNDIELLKIGRHYWQNKTKIIVGRDQEENQKIKMFSKINDVLIEMEDYPGPVTLVRNYQKKKILKTIIEKAYFLTQYHSPRVRFQKNVKFKTQTRLAELGEVQNS